MSTQERKKTGVRKDTYHKCLACPNLKPFDRLKIGNLHMRPKTLEYHVQQVHADHKGDWEDFIGPKVFKYRQMGIKLQKDPGQAAADAREAARLNAKEEADARAAKKAAAKTKAKARIEKKQAEKVNTKARAERIVETSVTSALKAMAVLRELENSEEDTEEDTEEDADSDYV